jgi:DNA-directed RNA polymerase specialized sigma24 family protein
MKGNSMGCLPVDLFESDWHRELHGPVLAARFHAWQQSEPALAGFDDPASLIRFLRGSGANTEKDKVLRALLVWARQEAIGARVVLEAMLPGLKKLAGRVLVDAREREELWSVVMACAWERIRTYPVERRPRKVAANLLLDCLHGTLATLSAARRDPTAQAVPPSHELEAVPVCEGDVDGLLAHAVTAGAVSRDEAELILSTRIDGEQLSDLARSQGVRFDTLKHRRNRAERRLLVFLGYRPVPQRGLRRPFSVARVAGVGPLGLAGGDDQSNQ